MLDIKHIIENADTFEKSAKMRNMNNVMPQLTTLYFQSIKLQQKIETLQQERNTLSKQSSVNQDDNIRAILIKKGKDIKQTIATLSKEYDSLCKQVDKLTMSVPNLYHSACPLGKEEKDNLVIKTKGKIPQFSFPIKDHIQIGTNLDIIDFEKAAHISGAKFYYLKNHAVLLELALLRYGIDILSKHGFDIFQTPDLAKISVIDKIGFNPRGKESNIYCLEDDNLALIGTSEITLGAYYADSILESKDLPIKIAGISHCFRKEAGAAGQYSRGLYRVHQFTKLEMFVFCMPTESDALHQTLLDIEEEIYTTLEIPYRIVDTCTGDLGAPAYRKYDIEAWMPGRKSNKNDNKKNTGEYGEVTSTSNCTDYQARRLKIRSQFVDTHGKKQRFFPHMLNGTAIAVPRTIVALLENFQNIDGSVTIPDALVPYCGFSTIPKKE